MATLETNLVQPSTGSTLTLGASGDTVALGTGASATGFGSPAYASNASATDDTVNVDASDNLQFNSGYGSTATAYGVRAWANFVSNGTFTILESKNVSSITDNGAGDFDFNFSSSMSDANYAVAGNTNEPSGNPRIVCVTSLATNTFKIFLEDLSSNRADADVICIIVVR